MKILYYGNCWATNIGEAMIDMGAVEMLKQALPEAQVLYISPMAGYYNNELEKRHKRGGLKFLNPANWTRAKGLKNAAHLGLSMDADLFVLGGMFATRNFPDLDGDYFVRPLFEKNKKLRTLFMGVGGLHYDRKEIQRFTDFAQGVMRPLGFISRDNTAYDIYKDKFKNSFSGIDCAFFCNDFYDPRGFAKDPYDVIAFNRTKEPKLFKNWPVPAVRAEHMFYYARYKPWAKNYFISDCPREYISLYANAREIHTDLVHATIMGLLYNRPVKYYHDCNRSRAFMAAGAVQDGNGFLSVSPDELKARKREMLENIRSIVLTQANWA